jgi:hypothetical protein
VLEHVWTGCLLLTSAAVADEDDLEAGAVHGLLVGERLEEETKTTGENVRKGTARMNEIAAKERRSPLAGDGFLAWYWRRRRRSMRPRSICNAGFYGRRR